VISHVLYDVLRQLLVNSVPEISAVEDVLLKIIVGA
jgi:hypothetical protein